MTTELCLFVSFELFIRFSMFYLPLIQEYSTEPSIREWFTL